MAAVVARPLFFEIAAHEINTRVLVVARGPDRLPAGEDSGAIELHVLEASVASLRANEHEIRLGVRGVGKENIRVEVLKRRDNVHELRIADAAERRRSANCRAAGHVRTKIERMSG